MALSLTSWLDPALKYFAEQSGIPVYDYSAQVGGEGIGNALEMTADFFTKGWLNRAIQGGAGLIASSYAVWGKDVPARLRKELLAIGTHEALRLVELKPGDIAEARMSLENFISAAQRGDWNTALSTVLTTPAEIQVAMGGIVPAGIIPPASSPPESGYSVKPEKTVPGKTTTQGKYVITG